MWDEEDLLAHWLPYVVMPSLLVNVKHVQKMVTISSEASLNDTTFN